MIKPKKVDAEEAEFEPEADESSEDITEDSDGFI